MIVPVLEAAVAPGVNAGDDVGGLVVGHRLRVDEPERLHGEYSQQDERNGVAHAQAAPAGKQGIEDWPMRS